MSDYNDSDAFYAGSEGELSSIGPYRILHLLGEGAYGRVYLAEQRDPLPRRVALKVVKPGKDDDEVLARFRAEQIALANLSHDCVAKVYDAGTTEAGRPYFAMEYVAGAPLTEYADRERLDVEGRLRLFQQVCEGAHHAHQKGIIHRDLKPSNILVQDGDTPRPRIIDFGIAKATFQHLLPDPAVTAREHAIGTPQYMSPEQADPTCTDIDVRSDVYSLGVVLYELLVGSVPIDVETIRDRGYAAIRDHAPPRPSTRLSSDASGGDVARARRVDITRLVKLLRGDLEAIVLKTLQKNRSDRYGSASDLALDIGRYLAHEPVLARSPTWAYRTTSFIRRNRLAVGASVAIVAGLAAALVIALLSMREARRQNDAAQRYLIEAMRAIQAQLVETASDTDLQSAALHPLRRKLLERALTAYQQLERTRADGASGPDTAQFRIVEALTLRMLAGLHAELERRPDADRTYRRAIDLLQPFAGARSPNIEGLLALAGTLNNFGEHRRAGDALADAEQDLLRAERIYRRVLDAEAENHEALEGLATTIGNRALVLVATARAADADPCYEEALRLKRELVRVAPTLENRVSRLALETNAALFFQQTDKPQRAEKLLRGVIDRYRALDDEADVAARRTAARACEWLARLLADKPGVTEAAAMFEEAIRLRRELIERRPGIPSYRQGLAASLREYASYLEGAHRSRDARVAGREAFAILDELVRIHPEVPGFRLDLVTLFVNGRQSWHGVSGMRAAKMALDYYREQCEARPDNVTYRRGLATTCLNLCAIHRARLDSREARRYGQLALTAFRALAAQKHARVQTEVQLAATLVNLADWDVGVGDFQAGEAKLQEARGILGRLVRDRADLVDPPIRLASALRALGNLRWDQRRIGDAEALYEQSLSVLTRLPETPAVRTERAETQGRFAMLHQVTGRLELARMHLKKSIRELTELVEHNERDSLRRELARAHQWMGLTLRHKDDATAIRHFAKSLELIANLRERRGELVSLLNLFVEVAVNAIPSYANEGDRDRAAELGREAVRTQKNLFDRLPQEPAVEKMLAAVHTQLCIVLQDKPQDRAEAKRHIRNAIDIYEKYLDRRQDNATLELRAAGAFGVYAGLLMMERDHEAALEWTDRTIELCGPMMKQTNAARYVRNAHETRANAFEQLARFKEAAAAYSHVFKADRAQGRKGDALRFAYLNAKAEDHRNAMRHLVIALRQPMNVYATFHAARTAAICKGVLRLDRGVGGSARERLERQYEQYAIRLLKKSRAMGSFESSDARTAVRDHADFDSLRSSAAFKQLLKALERE